MRRIMEWLRQPGNRGYLYRVLAALGVVATSYGMLSGHEAAVWLGLAAVVFHVTPALNTPTTAQLRNRQLDRPGHTYSSGGTIQPDRLPVHRPRKFERRG